MLLLPRGVLLVGPNGPSYTPHGGTGHGRLWCERPLATLQAVCTKGGEGSNGDDILATPQTESFTECSLTLLPPTSRINPPASYRWQCASAIAPERSIVLLPIWRCARPPLSSTSRPPSWPPLCCPPPTPPQPCRPSPSQRRPHSLWLSPGPTQRPTKVSHCRQCCAKTSPSTPP